MTDLLPARARRGPDKQSLRWPHISHSGLELLTSCERAWAFKYRDKLPDTPGPSQLRGTLLHRLQAEWWEYGDWPALAEEQGQLWIAENPEASSLPDWFTTAVWLMERYERHYHLERPEGDVRDEWEVLSVEIRDRVRLPGKYGWLVFVLDLVHRHRETGKLWVRDWKSSGKKNAMDDFYTWSPQVSLYFWAAQQLKLEPWGLIIDFAYSYRWKADRPTSETFELRWLDRGPEQLEQAVLEAMAGMDRARSILRGARPLRSVRDHCSWCPYRDPCRMELAFGPEYSLDVEEEES